MPSPSIGRFTTRINILLIAGLLSLAGVSNYAIETLRVGGPIYEDIIKNKDLVADILPPPLYLIEAYLNVNLVYGNPDKLDDYRKALALLHKEYDERQAYWRGARLSLKLIEELKSNYDTNGRVFWDEVERRFLPAIAAGDATAIRNSFEKVGAAYKAHRNKIDHIVENANTFSAEAESAAVEKLRWFLGAMAATTVGALALLISAILDIRSRVTKPLLMLADFVSLRTRDTGSLESKLLSRDDEIGRIAKALDSFRSAIEDEAVKAENVKLEAALNNIVQGIAMYDAEHRLVLCNNRFLEIYELSPKKIRPGMTLREVIGLRAANGLFTEEMARIHESTILRGLDDATHAQFLSHLKDNRSIAVTVQKLSTGSGMVTVHQDVTDQRMAEAKMAYIALHDALTDLPNRLALNEELEKALARVRRGEVIAVHIIDLDNFKAVNDTLGHPVGDKLLKMVADRLRAEVRESDMIARMGGDEFAIVESRISRATDVDLLASRIIEVVSQPYEIDGRNVVIGASIGIAMGPLDGGSSAELLRNADLALYQAKGDGRGVFRFFDKDMDAQMQARGAMELDLRNALSNSQFELHYQPIYDLSSNDIMGFEALLRWRHPKKGIIPPDAFIPLAEETRLIVPIGEWVIRNACAAIAQLPGHYCVAVNLSVVQFRSPALVEIVAEALKDSGIPPNRLELEITESLLLNGTEHNLSVLKKLRDLGVRIAMDDFGTGYSSLSTLQSFPFDKIKIDKSFISGVGNNSGSLNIIRAVASLANGLGITTTVEGVETGAQLDIARSEGCSQIQGYLMSKPLHIEELKLFLSSKPSFPPSTKVEIAA